MEMETKLKMENRNGTCYGGKGSCGENIAKETEKGVNGSSLAANR
jgi:hypothetical protein